MFHSVTSQVALGLVALAASVASCGCCVLPNSSGGGYLHTPPAAAFYDEPTVLEFDMVIYGAVGDGAEKRYTDESLNYRVKGHQTYATALLTRDVRDNANMTVKAKVPPISERDGDAVEYYYTFKLDGVISTHKSPDNPERIPLTKKRTQGGQ